VRRLLAACAASVALGAALIAGPAAAGATREQAGPESPAAVPDGFRAQSVTWVTPGLGWLLGTATCEGGEPCTPVLRTRDGGRTWSAAGDVGAPLAPPGEPGVADVDFAGPLRGWAFGPSLHTTADGGRTWREAPLPGGGQRVLDLVAGPATVYAVVSPCAIGEPPWECTEPPTLWRAPATPFGPARWRPVDVDLPVGAEAELAQWGRTAYVVGQLPPPTPDAFYATTDGVRWSERPSPCDKEGNGEVLVDVAPTSPSDVALLCVGSAGFSRAAKTAYRSTDAARTTTSAGTAPELGILTELAATRSGTLAMASTSSGSWIYLDDTGGTDWSTPVAEGDGGAGWNDLSFTTDRVGWVVYAPANWFPGTGTLMRTGDGGRTWAAAPLTG
jgi:photosystem II stability/assembly factor-like uncharacterized protein